MVNYQAYWIAMQKKLKDQKQANQPKNELRQWVMRYSMQSMNWRGKNEKIYFATFGLAVMHP